MTNKNHTASTPTPVQVDPIRVSARLLHPYVVNSPTPFADWKNSLREIAVDLDLNLRGYRVFEDNHGELTLNHKLATHFVMSASTFPKGAAAWALLVEASNDEGSGNVDYIDRKLEKHRLLGILPHLVQAEALHEFLCCETAFDDWFLEQKEGLRMVCGRDYIGIDGLDAGQPTIHQNDGGTGEIFLGHEAAKRVIMSTPTHRGKVATSGLLQRFC